VRFSLPSSPFLRNGRARRWRREAFYRHADAETGCGQCLVGFDEQMFGAK
jgi:hypothetical protein